MYSQRNAELKHTSILIIKNLYYEEILSFARALGEFGATLMMAGNIPGKTQTMPLAIFFQVQAMNYKGAMLWVATIVAISVVMILVLNFWSDKQQDLVGKRSRGGK